MRLLPVVLIVGLAVLPLSACASSKSDAAHASSKSGAAHLTTHSCRAPSHYYPVAEIERAFAAHGVRLQRGNRPPATQRGSVPRAFRTGQIVTLVGPKPVDVVLLVITPRTPLWLDKLALYCGAPAGESPLGKESVLGNVSVSYRANAASAVKAALAQLQ